MKHVMGENTRIELVYGYTCDSCQMEIVTPSELQESLTWSNRGGSGSVFGDGTDMTLDLCQRCIKEHLGKFIQFHGNAYFPEISPE